MNFKQLVVMHKTIAASSPSDVLSSNFINRAESSDRVRHSSAIARKYLPTDRTPYGSISHDKMAPGGDVPGAMTTRGEVKRIDLDKGDGVALKAA